MSSALDALALPPQPAPYPQRQVVLGLDLGQAADQSALCATDYQPRLIKPSDPLFGEDAQWEDHYTVLGLHMFPLGTPYPQIAQRVNVLAKRLWLRDDRGAYTVVADAGGPGRPVIDLIRSSIIPAVRVVACTITSAEGGDPYALHRVETRVGKRWLVSRLMAILQGNRLHVPRDPMLQQLMQELREFQINVRPSGYMTAEAPAGKHDDAVLALALSTISGTMPVVVDHNLDHFTRDGGFL